MSAAKKDDSDKSSLRDALISKIKGAEDPDETNPETRPVARRDESERTKANIFGKQISFFNPNLDDMAAFSRQLATLISVGIPLVRSLKILSTHTQHPRLKYVVRKVSERVEEGQTLSTSLSEHPRIFSSLFVNVAKIGEVGGILEESLKRLADIFEKKAEIKKRIIGSIMYPVVALLVCLGVICVVLTVAIPRFEEVYAERDVDLPSITQTIINISHFIREQPHIYIPLIVILLAAMWVFSRTPTGKSAFDWVKLRFPIVGPINKKINVARFSRTISGLVGAGIPLLEALSVTAGTSENSIVGQTLVNARDNVEKGGKMEEPLRKGNVFPPMVVDMISIGDEAGAIDEVLDKVADAYEYDVDSTLKGLTSIIEPVLIVALGFVVILIALAVLLPYFNLVSVIE